MAGKSSGLFTKNLRSDDRVNPVCTNHRISSEIAGTGADVYCRIGLPDLMHLHACVETHASMFGYCYGKQGD